MCEIMDRLVKENEEKARLEGEASGRLEGEALGRLEGERIGEMKVIRNYAAANNISFAEAMIKLHISKQDQKLIMEYL